MGADWHSADGFALTLVAARLVPLVVVVGRCGSWRLPWLVLAVVVFASGLALWPVATGTIATGHVVPWSLMFVAREVLVGLVLGLLCLLAGEAAFMAGHLVDQAILRGVPWDGGGPSPGGPPALLLGGLTVTVFLVLGGYRPLLAGLADSYRVLPLDRWSLLPQGASPGVVGVLSVMVAQAMALVWRLAAPVLVASAMAELIMAAIARVTALTHLGPAPRGGAVPLVVLLLSILGMAQETVRFLMEIPRFFHWIATIVTGGP